jgi:hypothetical protein
MDRVAVSSTDIREIGYDARNHTLEVAFHSSGIYQYFDVPVSEYQGLIAAPSHGRYFQAHIKNSYRWQRVG